jgi:hypothetical protein
MTSEPTREEELRWLLEPAEPGTIHFHIDIGEGAELTPEARQAIDRFIAAIYPDPDVSGFLMRAPCQPKVVNCWAKVTCPDYHDPTCPEHRCLGYSCRIAPPRLMP